MATIQWFPGHMAKARREATEKLKLVDVVIEMVDARIPESSRNPIIEEIKGQKKQLILLNKVDLADPSQTKRWNDYFTRQGIKVLSTEAKDGKGIKQVKAAIKELMAPIFEKNLEKEFEKKISLEKVEEIWKDNEDNRKKIKKVYGDLKGNLNTNSMTLFSGIREVQIYTQYDSSYIKVGCLYTGDYEAKGKNKWKTLEEAYQEYWEWIGYFKTFQVYSSYRITLRT